MSRALRRLGLASLLAAVALAQSCASAPAAADSAAPAITLVPYRDQSPSTAEVPSPPAIADATPAAERAERELARNGALAGALGAEGERAVFRFESRAGELSLFELEAFGMARGWASAARVRILDEAGAALIDVTRAGGSVYTSLVGFVAPRDGVYRYELAAEKEHFRYTLVRHSGLLPLAPLARAHLGDRGEACGYLLAREDVARFALDLAEGELVRIEVMPLREDHRSDQHKKQRALLTGYVERDQRPGLPDVGVLLEELRGRARERDALPPYPFFGLALEGVGPALDGAALPDRAPLLFFRAPAAGTYALDVVARDESEGGIFVLRIERSPTTHAVTGRVGDFEDQPVAGATVRFLFEPALAVMAETVSRADGTFDVELPAGDYTILVAGDPESPATLARTPIAGAAEVNLVFDASPASPEASEESEP